MPDTIVHLVGIDCAVQDKKIGLAWGTLGGTRLEIRSAMHGGASD